MKHFHFPPSTFHLPLSTLLLLLITALAAFLRFYHLDRLPPGLWYDEAWISVAARDSAAAGVYPVYYAASFGGMHPAVVYLTRLARWLAPDNPLAIRYALATVGAFTVPFTYAALKAIFQLDQAGHNPQSTIRNPHPAIRNPQSAIRNPQPLALLGAFILSITFPFFLFSRLGFESMLPSPASALVFLALAVALRRQAHYGRAYSWFAFTGLLMGLALYSFDTARFIPLAVALAYWGYRSQRPWPAGQRLAAFGLLTAVATAVFLPLGHYFLQNWGQFTERARITTYNTLGPGAESVPLALWQNLIQTVAGLSLPGFGDVIVRHNLPGRPVFDLFLSLLFWLGIVTLLRHWRRPSSILLGSWAAVMLLPVILTDGAPTYTRIFGALPALAGVAAVGAMRFGQMGGNNQQSTINSQQSTINSQQLTVNSQQLTAKSQAFIFHLSLSTLFLFFGLVFSTAVTTYDYFVRWAADPRLFDDFHVADWQVTHLARARLATDTVYLAPDLISEAHPTFDLLLRDTAVRTFTAPCLVYADRPEQPLTYLVQTQTDQETIGNLRAVYSQSVVEDIVRQPLTGQVLFQSLRVAQGTAAVPAPGPPVARFGETIQLLAYEIEPVEAQATLSLALTLHWQALARPPADHTLFLHLYAAGQEDSPPLAQLDVQPCQPTGRWHAGEVIGDRHVFTWPPALPGGRYVLAIGLYTWPTFERLPLTASERSLPDQRHVLAEWQIGE